MICMQREARPAFEYRRRYLPLRLYLLCGCKERLVAANRIEKHALVRVRYLVREEPLREEERQTLRLKLEVKPRPLRPKEHRYLVFWLKTEGDDVLIVRNLSSRTNSCRSSNGHVGTQARRRLKEYRNRDLIVFEGFAALEHKGYAAPAVVLYMRGESEIRFGRRRGRNSFFLPVPLILPAQHRSE